jgi:RNA polymerase sigma-70 factor (ECF subfamily)
MSLSVELETSARRPFKPAPDLRDRNEWASAVEEHLGALRGFARSLCGNVADADDLVQETLTRSWAHRERFTPGTNLRAWLFVILRNAWYSTAAKRRRETEDPDGLHAGRLAAPGEQDVAAELRDVFQAMELLVPEYREAIVLVAAAGLNYEEAAEVAGCPVGTIKSRLSRGRRRLQELLDARPGESPLDRPGSSRAA